MGESARWAGAPRTMTPASYASPGVASSVNGHRAAGGQLLVRETISKPSTLHNARRSR